MLGGSTRIVGIAEAESMVRLNWADGKYSAVTGLLICKAPLAQKDCARPPHEIRN